MMRIGLFVVILVLVCVPLVWLQAEGRDPTTNLIDAPTLERWTEGVAAFSAEDFDHAIAKFQELVEQNPESWRSHYMLGLSLQRKGRWEEALHHLRKASGLNSEGIAVQLSLEPTDPGLRRQASADRLWPCLAQSRPGAPQPGTPTPGAPKAERWPDPCDVGDEISRMTPCTSAEDCPAHELWSSTLGAPGPQRARPERR